MESHDETGCQAREGPILCVNNCGFFGSAATMNMCSKCHKDMMMKQDQAKLAASSIGSIVNGNAQNTNAKDHVVEAKIILTEPSRSSDATPSEILVVKPKEGPNRCASCQKRVGLTGFSCKCGNLFCATHRYSEKHECPFDYQAAGRDAISKSNPVIKADKLDKI